MPNQSGTFLVLEGSDGSGKATQLKLLAERLRAVGYEVEVFDFPQYDNPSSHFVQRYLAGDYGPATKVSPYTASIFFALDRFEAAPKIKKALEGGKIVLSNRFVGANMAHQGSKFKNQVEQRSFFVWEDSLEYQLLGVPRPRVNLFLRVPSDVSIRLINERSQKSGKALDEHEKDSQHLKDALATYDLLCKLFPSDYQAIDCSENGQLLSITDISNLIWQKIQPLLPPRPQGRGGQRTVKIELPTPAVTPAAKRPDARGVAGPSATETFASLELTLLIIQAIPHASFEVWDGKNYLRDFGRGVDESLKTRFNRFMRDVGESYKKLSAGIGRPDNSDLAMNLAPLAARVKVTLNLSEQEAQRLLTTLSASRAPESKALAITLKKHFGLKADSSKTQPSNIDSVLKDMANRIKDQHLPPEGDAVSVVEAYPKNEFQLLADIVYPISDLPKKQVEHNLQSWSYQQKYDALVAAAKAKDERVLGQVRYRFDALLSSAEIIKLVQLDIASEVTLQPPTPRLGYKVPESLEPLGFSDLYEHCFDKSLEFYSAAESHEHLARSGVLLGHKRRCQFSISAAGLARLLDSSEQALANQLAQKAAEFHPVILDTLTSQKSASGARVKRR